MRHAHSGKIPFDCPFFSTAGHTLTRELVITGFSKYLVLLTVCPLARRKKGHRDFATFATVAVRGGTWLLQRSPWSRGLSLVPSCLYFTANYAKPGVQGPAGP